MTLDHLYWIYIHTSSHDHCFFLVHSEHDIEYMIDAKLAERLTQYITRHDKFVVFPSRAMITSLGFWYSRFVQILLTAG